MLLFVSGFYNKSDMNRKPDEKKNMKILVKSFTPNSNGKHCKL